MKSGVSHCDSHAGVGAYLPRANSASGGLPPHKKKSNHPETANARVFDAHLTICRNHRPSGQAEA